MLLGAILHNFLDCGKEKPVLRVYLSKIIHDVYRKELHSLEPIHCETMPGAGETKTASSSPSTYLVRAGYIFIHDVLPDYVQPECRS